MGYLPRLPSAKSALEYLPTGTSPSTVGGSAPSGHLSTFWRSLGEAIETMAAYYAAAEMYHGLARLSDSELHRRGLSRATLARDVVAACERTEGLWRGR
jgi:hypothetical protein